MITFPYSHTYIVKRITSEGKLSDPPTIHLERLIKVSTEDSPFQDGTTLTQPEKLTISFPEAYSVFRACHSSDNLGFQITIEPVSYSQLTGLTTPADHQSSTSSSHSSLFLNTPTRKTSPRFLPSEFVIKQWYRDDPQSPQRYHWLIVHLDTLITQGAETTSLGAFEAAQKALDDILYKPDAFNPLTTNHDAPSPAQRHIKVLVEEIKGLVNELDQVKKERDKYKALFEEVDQEFKALAANHDKLKDVSSEMLAALQSSAGVMRSLIYDLSQPTRWVVQLDHHITVSQTLLTKTHSLIEEDE